MLNRRHIRAKVMQVIYSSKCNSNSINTELNNYLGKSMLNVYKLYLLMLYILIKLRQRAIEHQEISKNKFLKTNEDDSPSMRFVNNVVLKKLDENQILKNDFVNYEISYWDEDSEYIELLYKDRSQYIF